MAKSPKHRLIVYSVPADSEPGKKQKIGLAFRNMDGTLAIYLDELPIGTNKLAVEEEAIPTVVRR